MIAGDMGGAGDFRHKSDQYRAMRRDISLEFSPEQPYILLFPKVSYGHLTL
jgi:hypothetical protein